MLDASAGLRRIRGEGTSVIHALQGSRSVMLGRGIDTALSWAARSHVGNVRVVNEDSVLAAPPFFVVADGMGGHAAGDVASATAVRRLDRLGATSLPSVDEVLSEVAAINEEIAAIGSAYEHGIGTTLTGLVLVRTSAGPDAIVVNVGDSRSYLLRSGELSQVTADHSVVQELIDEGLLDERDALDHPDRNVITRALGTDAAVDVDVTRLTLRAGDRFIICSDGLSSEVDAATMRALAQGEDAQQTADLLIDAALRAGGRDNVSVVVVDVGTVDDPNRTDPRGRHNHSHAGVPGSTVATGPGGDGE